MKSPFLRFTLAFVACVLVAGVFYVWFARRNAVVTTSVVTQPAVSSPAVPAPQTATAPAPPASANAPTQPLPMDAPPDIRSLNFAEVTAPGADLHALPPSSAVPGDYVAELTAQKLATPIEGLKPKDFSDNFNDARGGAPHEATDIMTPRGTPVHAMTEGNIVKLFTSRKGGLTIYQFDDARKYCFYYAHLDRYAPDVKEGMLVRPGQVIGFAGSTGDANANAPHLHLAIALLGPDKKYWQGTPVNPFPVLQKIVAGR